MRKKDSFTIKTLKQAKRIVTIVIGFTIILLGAAMLLLPGPGLATIIAGLAILGTEFVWAKRLLKRFGDSANNIKNSLVNNFNKKVKNKK
ncbi:putative transmembrane protein [bacterium BMS3Abin06]|nr:putative transmembrane protein [bacterium BMS3Abin06]